MKLIELKNIFSYKNYIFPCVVILLFILLSFLKINGSSSGVYDKYYYGTYNKEDFILGEPRLIRGDEWLVMSNWLLSQTRNKFSIINPNIGDGQNMSFVGVPTKSWYIIFKPSNIIFLLTNNVDFAFSFRWWFNSAMLFISTYIFFLFFSKNIVLSVLMSISIYFSPFIQWWYSSMGYLELVSYSFFVSVLFIIFIKCKKKINALILIIFILYLVLCILFVLYPPGMIAIFFVFFTFLVSYFFSDKHNFHLLRQNYLFKVYFIIIALLFILFVSLSFFISNKTEIDTITNTAYPGKRVVSGGGFSLYRFVSSFYDIQLLDDSRLVPNIIGHNQSEASGCLFFSIVIIPLILIDSFDKLVKRKKINFILLFLSLLMFVLIFWMVIGFGNFGEKLFPLNMVPPNRAMIAIILINFLLIFFYLIDKNDYVKYNKIKLLLSIISTLAIFVFGLYLRSSYPQYIYNLVKIILISSIGGILTISLFYKKKIIFLFILCIFSITSTYRVNPLSFFKFKNIDRMDSFFIDLDKNLNYNNSKWVVYNDFVLANKLISNGVNVLNGTHYYPQLKFWGDLSAKKEDNFIFNRYAHVLFTHSMSDSLFKLINTDTFEININPCDIFFKKYNVKYFVFRERKEYSCLRQIGISPVEFYYVYEIK